MLLRGPKQQQVQTKGHAHRLHWLRPQRAIDREQDGLSGDDRADINSRLDDLNASVNAQWRGGD